MRNYLIIVTLFLLIPLFLIGCKQESSLANIAELHDSYSVSIATIGSGNSRLTIEYPSTWINGIPYQDKLTGQIKGVPYDDRVQAHGNIGGYQSVISVLPPNKGISYKDCVSTIRDSIIQNVKGIDVEDILIEDKGGYSILSYSDDEQYNRTYVYRYDKDTTIIIIGALERDARQSDTNMLSDIILGMMKSIKPNAGFDTVP